MDGPDGTLIGLLGEVVGIVPVAQISAHPPDVGLGLGHEPFESSAVAVLGRDEEPGEVVHRPSVSQLGNQIRPSSDPDDVNDDRENQDQCNPTFSQSRRANCSDVREILSARLDGETSTDEDAFAADHITTCVDCGAHATALQQLERSIRVRPAEPVPDLVGSVVARARPARLGRGGWLRPALAWVAIVMFVQSVPALVLVVVRMNDTG